MVTTGDVLEREIGAHPWYYGLLVTPFVDFSIFFLSFFPKTSLFPP